MRPRSNNNVVKGSSSRFYNENKTHCRRLSITINKKPKVSNENEREAFSAPLKARQGVEIYG